MKSILPTRKGYLTVFVFRKFAYLMQITAIMMVSGASIEAQQVTDPTAVTLSERNLKVFRGNRDALIAFYTSKLRQFAIDGKQLDLSTLDAWLEMQNVVRRGQFVGQFLGNDLNWDGEVTRDEFNSVYSEDQIETQSGDPWMLGAASNDLNGDNTVTIAELLEVAEENYTPDRSLFREAEEMRNWDLNGDSYVTVAEVEAVIAANTSE